MTTYIAQFSAVHKNIRTRQSSVFTWKQEGGEIDMDLLKDKIKRESSLHFYKLLARNNDSVHLNDIEVHIKKTQPFSS